MKDEFPRPNRSQMPIVFASVGTDVHPFNRLVSWLDDLAVSMPNIETVVQYGRSVPPTYASGVDYLTHKAQLEWFRRAVVVITHGGPATIMEVRGTHGKPVVVPRNPELGEHVDGHQMEFCALLGRRGDVDLAQSSDHLHTLVESRLASPVSPIGVNGDIPQGVKRFQELVGDLLTMRPTRNERRRR